MPKHLHDLPALEELLCFALHAAARAAEASYRPALGKLGLTYTQYLAMLVAWERDGQTVGEFGERLLLESGTLTPLMQRLENRGWIARQRDPKDERIVRIVVTRSGRLLKARVSEGIHALVCQLGLSRGDSDRLRDEVNNYRKIIRARTPAINGPRAGNVGTKGRTI